MRNVVPSGDAPGPLRQVVLEAQGDTKVGMAVSPPGLPTEQQPQQGSPTCMGVGAETGSNVFSLHFLHSFSCSVVSHNLFPQQAGNG